MWTEHRLTVPRSVRSALHTTNHVTSREDGWAVPGDLPASSSFLSSNFLLILQAPRPASAAVSKMATSFSESTSEPAGWFPFPVPSLS